MNNTMESLSNDSVNSLGEEMTYKDILQLIIDKEVRSIWIDFAIDFILLLLILVCILVDKYYAPGGRQGCGIPIREWIMIFFAIWLSKGFVNLFKICIVNKCYKERHQFSLISSLVMNGLLFGWLIFGLVLFCTE